jgi:diadenosine tetraphosphatase ApaH/serine/threonine PP2A family protein phosphatase
MDETRQKCYNWGQLPPAEYRMTEQHIRSLWRIVKQVGGEGATNEDTPHIGSLLSDVLEEPNTEPTPAVLWNKGPRNQSWEVLAE